MVVGTQNFSGVDVIDKFHEFPIRLGTPKRKLALEDFPRNRFIHDEADYKANGLLLTGGLVRACLRRFDGLQPVLELVRFFVAAKFAKGVSFGGQIADEIRAVEAELLFGQSN
jgi:hypothetical protein